MHHAGGVAVFLQDLGVVEPPLLDFKLVSVGKLCPKHGTTHSCYRRLNGGFVPTGCCDRHADRLADEVRKLVGCVSCAFEETLAEYYAFSIGCVFERLTRKHRLIAGEDTLLGILLAQGNGEALTVNGGAHLRRG